MTASLSLVAEPMAAPTVLPVHLTRFVGREGELREVLRLLGASRMLTLTGAGGSGKTRLALETAREAAGRFSRTVWLDLAPLGAPGLVAHEAAVAFGVADRADASTVELLAAVIGAEPVLLVLDNCEHLVDAGAELAETLLRGCPRLVVLATSREALGVTGETAWLVPPLDPAAAADLFVERAQAALPTFALREGAGEAVGEICRRLDGIPLAIELAAARVRVLSPEQIAERLDDAFRLLTSGSRTALPRHRTLRATMEWSYALLGNRERVLLRRLAVFAGGFTLDAAEAVCAGGELETEDVLDGVAALVDRSLVVMEPGEGAARYRLLLTVRQYGRELLAEAGEADDVARRHAEHFVALAETAAPHLVGGSNRPGLVQRLRVEHDDLRAAAAWAAADGSRAELALRFAGALYWFWYAIGQFREAREIVDRALALDAPAAPLHRGRALVASALTALAQGDYPLARRDFERALPLLREAGDDAGEATALAKLGAARLLGGDLAGAVLVLDEAVALTRDWPPHDIGPIFARYWRGLAAYAAGDAELAHALLAPNVAAAREHELPTTLAHTLAALARIALARGDVDEARAVGCESLELEMANGDAWGVAVALDVLAEVAARRGRPTDAVRILAGVDAHRARLAVALPGLAPADRERLLDELRGTVGARFDELRAEGLALSTPKTVATAFAAVDRPRALGFITTPAITRTRDVPAAKERLGVLALGPLQVFVGGQLVESAAWGSARTRELLVYLLMHPEGRTKEQVGLVLWPEASAAQLRNSFHVTLHRLRKAIRHAEWVTVTDDRYRVDPSVVAEFDVPVFERQLGAARRALFQRAEGAVATLETTLARYRGDFLDGEPVGDWHLEHRDRLQRLYLMALMELGEHLVGEERWAKAAEAYRRVLARDDLHEEAARALMRCHAALGERPQALRLYQRLAARLASELESEPDEETRELAERIQKGE